MYDKIFPPKSLTLPNGKIVKEKRSRTPIVIVFLMIALFFSIKYTGFDINMLVNRWREFFVIVSEMIPPKWEYVSHIWRPLLDTIKMSLLGSMIGSLVAVPVAFLAASNMIKNKWIVGIFKILLSMLRTMPTLVSALIATYIFGLGTLAGTIAIFLFTLSYVGKLLYEQIENVDMGAFEAMEAIGMTRMQAFRYAVIPQILPNYLSVSLFCFEGNVRYAAILGYVGAGGIGLILNEGMGWRDYASVGMILLMLIVTVYVIEAISEHFRKRLI
ncbi:phosphonate ABC transporter, permease protein PhnE [Ornithinibacillus massiliensis]|uniref:Phosphonate ABC transporter, permease protein PhnE n=1 Tax=Ornithinibacillus massiliensis TaxID=1944633 RepID=A0ABS5MHR3_9BACI|nr:phosphonate ABC transporter, permease protein PhnE [Ornithinibacillus massiliensis]MBS3681876.1 phosphonate ABC transporter, permease protein PhnE [Ornithinibacillus massiliensis]